MSSLTIFRQIIFILCETLSNQQKIIAGNFIHGFKLKSYIFEKYKTKKE